MSNKDVFVSGRTIGKTHFERTYQTNGETFNETVGRIVNENTFKSIVVKGRQFGVSTLNTYFMANRAKDS